MQNKNEFDQKIKEFFNKLNIDDVYNKCFQEVNIWNWQISEEHRKKIIKEGTIF